MKIIPSCIRNDDNCLYDSVFAAIQISTTRTPKVHIILEMEQRLIDNPVSFLIRLIVGLKHENLDNNRENFIFEATGLSSDQAAAGIMKSSIVGAKPVLYKSLHRYLIQI